MLVKEENLTMVSQWSVRVRFEFEFSIREKLRRWPGLTQLVISTACHLLYSWSTFYTELSADRATMIDNRIALSLELYNIEGSSR